MNSSKQECTGIAPYRGYIVVNLASGVIIIGRFGMPLMYTLAH